MQLMVGRRRWRRTLVGALGVAGVAVLAHVGPDAQVAAQESIAGYVRVATSGTGVVLVSVDVPDRYGQVDGQVDRAFVIQQEGSRLFEAAGVGRVIYNGTRLTVTVPAEAGTRVLVFRIEDKDPAMDAPTIPDVVPAVGIASWSASTGGLGTHDRLYADRIVPLRPPSCQNCWSGGEGATSCSQSCANTSCQVTCTAPYSACCNCPGYAQCFCCKD